MKMNYEMIAKAFVVLFSLCWVVAILKTFFIAGFSIRILLNPSFLILLLAALIIPIAVVWAVFIYLNK